MGGGAGAFWWSKLYIAKGLSCGRYGAEGDHVHYGHRHSRVDHREPEIDNIIRHISEGEYTLG